MFPRIIPSSVCFKRNKLNSLRCKNSFYDNKRGLISWKWSTNNLGQFGIISFKATYGPIPYNKTGLIFVMNSRNETYYKFKTNCSLPIFTAFLALLQLYSRLNTKGSCYFIEQYINGDEYSLCNVLHSESGG